MNKEYGGNLVEYTIPTAIIGLLVGLSLFSLAKEGTILNYFKASINGEQYGNVLTLGHQPLPGDGSGGTGDGKKFKNMSCTLGGQCTLDFGSFILTGVPENVGDVTTAKRGGDLTLEYADMLKQLSDQTSSTDPGTSDYLLKLAKIAKNMGLAEINVDETMTDLYAAQHNKIATREEQYAIVEKNLANVDPNNLVQRDFVVLERNLRFLNYCGIITKGDKQDASGILMTIYQDNPNLSQDQIDFINTLKTSPEEVSSVVDATMGGLSESQQSLIAVAGSKREAMAQDHLNKSLDYVNSIDGGYSEADAGKNFNDLLMQLPQQSMSDEMKSVVSEICSEVQKVGNNVIYTNDVIDDQDHTLIQLLMSPSAGIQTLVAANLMKEAAQ